MAWLLETSRADEVTLVAVVKVDTSGIIYLDFPKAFGIVTHDLHMYKLERFWTCGVLYELFSRYLNGAKQRIVTKGDFFDLNRIVDELSESSILHTSQTTPKST